MRTHYTQQHGYEWERIWQEIENTKIEILKYALNFNYVITPGD